MSVIRHACRIARVLADLILVGSGSRVAYLAEVDGGDAVLRVLLAHGHGCGVGQRGVRTLGCADGKAELIGVRPVAAVNGLAQAKVELSVERGHAVGVLESCFLNVLQNMRGAERAVAVVRDGGLDGELGIAVGDTAGVALDLAQRIDVRSGLGVLDGAHRDLAIGGVLAGGDDVGVLALDELEGELALSHVAAGQNLGRGDLVGDARLNRRHAIGIDERKGCVAIRLAGHPQITLAVIGHGKGNRTRRLGVVGHASDLTGLGHGVGKGVLALLGLLAQSLVKVVERKGNLAKVDLALGIIGHARVRGHGCALFTGHGKGELAVNVGRGQTFGELQVLDARKRCLGSIRGVGVLELDTLDVLGALLQLVRGHQLALAVIADGRHDGVGRAIVGNAAGIALDLAQRVDVLTDLGVLDSLELNIAVGVILDGLDNLRVFAETLAQLKAELAGLEVASGQDLGHLDLVGDA